MILSSEETDDQRPNRYFVVTRTLKYHGYAINQIAIPRTPDRETLASLVDGAEGRLSPDHPGIQQWIAAGFVLGVESDDSRDQEIEAYVLVDFLRARDDIGSQLFDLIAREDLLSDPHVLSIYEGYGVQMNTQFVLRLRAIPQDLFAFVEHFHRRCDQAFLRAQTNTYIVASRITNHLYHTLLMPPLNEVDKNVRDVLIVPELSPDEQAEFLYQPAEAQTATIQSVAQIDRTFATLELPGEMAAPKDLRSLRRQVIRAVATSNSAELRHAYLDLWALIEPPLRDQAIQALRSRYPDLREAVSDRIISSAAATKGNERLTLGQVRDIMLSLRRAHPTAGDIPPHQVLDALQEIVPLRNALMHGEPRSSDMLGQGLVGLVRFLAVLGAFLVHRPERHASPA